AERLTGWSSADAAGKPVGEVFRLVRPVGGPQSSPVGHAIHDAFAVEVPSGTALVSKAGASIAINDNSAPIVDGAGRVLGGVVVFRDVTERKNLEERLAASERLAALGTMAASMGHELNNPLSYLVTNVAFAL